MVEITEEEFREYIDLKRKEAERDKRIQEMLAKGPTVMKKWRTNLNTLRGYASTFANVLEKECARRDYPIEFVLDRWYSVKKYMPEKVMCMKKGKPNIKHTFRKHLKDFGWTFKIDYKQGLFIVKKIL